MATEKVHDYLVERIRRLPQADAISLIDSTGKVVNFSRAWPIPATTPPAENIFERCATRQSPARSSGCSFQNSTNGTWDIPIERRINNAKGEFLGLVNMMVEARYFEALYQSLATHEGESIAIFRSDGPLLARSRTSKK